MKNDDIIEAKEFSATIREFLNAALANANEQMKTAGLKKKLGFKFDIKKKTAVINSRMADKRKQRFVASLTLAMSYENAPPLDLHTTRTEFLEYEKNLDEDSILINLSISLAREAFLVFATIAETQMAKASVMKGGNSSSDG